jgi:hypothetical protein
MTCPACAVLRAIIRPLARAAGVFLAAAALTVLAIPQIVESLP